MEYTPISQLKQRFGSPFNSINISLAAVNRKTQLERERKREKRRECFTTICLTLLKLEDLKLDTRKSVKKKIARIPPKDIHQFQEMQFFAIPKTVSKRLLGFEGGWTTSTHVGFSLVEPDGHTSTQFHYPFHGLQPMIQGPFFGDFGIPSASICSQKTLPGMMT